MTSGSGNAGSRLVIAIGLIASVITIFIFVTGVPSLRHVFPPRLPRTNTVAPNEGEAPHSPQRPAQPTTAKRPAEPIQSAGKPVTPGDTHQESLPPVRIRKIMGVLYSYSKNQWGGYGSMAASEYPQVSGLTFASGLIVSPAGFSWTGAHSFVDNQLCLSITGLRVPSLIPTLKDYYADVALGYQVRLEGAVFGDRTMAKALLLFRTFGGDTPPQVIQKCYPVFRIEDTPTERTQLAGEWEGKIDAVNTNGEHETTYFVARLEQSGNRFTGASLEVVQTQHGSAPAKRVRSSIEGWITNDTVTFVKSYTWTPWEVSVVATLQPTGRDLTGSWYAALAQGQLHMHRRGDFTGSVNDLVIAQPNTSR